MPRRKPALAPKVTNIRIDDCGGYFQAYEEMDSGNEMKLGNIKPPRYTSFKDETPVDSWIAEGLEKRPCKDFKECLAYLISPRYTDDV